MAASSSSSSLSSTCYDIFLSFRGEDTRKNFTSHLFAALKHQGYKVFHDTLLQRGQSVSLELLKAIEESKLSIVVFSKNYADSRWCLDELVKIMECRRSSQQIVLPVFYGTEPSDVRNQTGSYATPLTNNMFGLGDKWKEDLDKSKVALEEAGNLSGLHLQNDSNGDEADFITKIVKQVVENLDQPYLNVADYPVGIEPHVENLKGLLSLGTNDIHIVAIWGVGGIGKTTIAKATFNKIYRSFEGSCFLADVGTIAMQPDGLVTLQERLISSVLKQNMPKIHNCHQGIEVIKQRLWSRRVLIVLDDVNSISQLENLAIKRSWLPKGSRVIITTRDSFSVTSLDAILYEPQLLSARDSLNLFKWHVYGDEYPKQVYEMLSKEVVDYAGGLPLVLKTLGTYMRSLRTIEEWQEAVERLRIIPPDDVQEKLKLSFDSLRGGEKELFLDIACFFIGMDKDLVFQVLDENDNRHYPKFEFKVLYNRCLVKTDGYGKLSMHDMVRDMGREIVRQESLNDPERRSRLWYPNDVLFVLKESLGTEAIESIILELAYPDEEPVDVNVLAKMSKLRMIQFRHLNLHGTYNGTQSLHKLKWFSWYGFPLTCIPPNLDMQNLVALNLQKSNLRKLWKGPKVFRKLRFLDVSDSYFLTCTPDFSGVMNLEKLQLRNCTSLVEIHDSIRCLDKLTVLDVQNCKRLVRVPSGILQLKSLKDANLSGCSRLFEVPCFEVSFCSLCHLFSSVLLWKSMENRRDWTFLLTSAEEGQSCLKELRLENCNLRHVPIEIGSLASLEELYLSSNRFSNLPASIKDLHHLHVLEVKDCSELKTIVDLPSNPFLLVKAEGSLALETIQVTSERSTPAHVLISKGTKLLDIILTNKEQGLVLSKFNVLVGIQSIPHWFNYQGVGRFISFVAPKHNGGSIRGWIVGVSVVGAYLKFFNYNLVYVYNKTKDRMHTIFVGLGSANNLLISYIQFSKYGIVVDGGDEIEILFAGTAPVHTCGLHLVNERDEGLELHEHLVIQYSPPDIGSSLDNMMNQEEFWALVMKPVLRILASDAAANLLGPLQQTMLQHSEVLLKLLGGLVSAASEGIEKEPLFGPVNKFFPFFHRSTSLLSEGYVIEALKEAHKGFGFVKEPGVGIIKDAIIKC